MIDLARKNAAKKGLKPPHVAFVQALLTEPLPIESNSVDCILSNCVVNLLPFEGKASLLKEVYRILKPGGRIVLDDVISLPSTSCQIILKKNYHFRLSRRSLSQIISRTTWRRTLDVSQVLYLWTNMKDSYKMPAFPVSALSSFVMCLLFFMS